MLGSRGPIDEPPFINMTPMVDVMLCLLIFFMAATRLYDWDEEQFTVRVPEAADASPLTPAPEDISLTILEPGRVAIKDKNYSLDELVGVLNAARQAYSDQGVLIRGDASLSYQDLADVLSACETAGIANVRLPVKPRTENATP
jgi:biopolymer transport protein ExbD